MSERARLDRASRIVVLNPGPWKLVAVVVLVGVAACTGPAPRPVDELVREGDVYLDPETLQPYSGPVFVTFDDQPLVVAQRLSLREGTYDGPFEAYFENRQLSSKEIYREGVKDGPYEWYFENGRLFEKGTYRGGRLGGRYEAYWDNGDLYEEGTYLHGDFDGPRKWYLEGELIELVTYRNGVMDGPYERYREDGALDLKGTLVDGTPCGVWLEGGATLSYPACGGASTD
jgi:MORN repeat variant